MESILIYSLFIHMMVWTATSTKTRTFTWHKPTLPRIGGYKVFHRMKARSILDCIHTSILTSSDFAAYNGAQEINCILLGKLKLPYPVEGIYFPDKSWQLYSGNGTIAQVLGYRVTTRTGINALGYLLSNQTSPLDNIVSAYDLNTPLPGAFKHPLIEEWSEWDIQRVVYQMWKNGAPVVDMTFSAENADKTSWFNISNVEKSQWTDLNSLTEAESFRVRKDGTRGFWMQLYGGECEGDKLWSVVLDGPQWCTWEDFPSYPMFLYSTQDHAVDVNDNNLRLDQRKRVFLSSYTPEEGTPSTSRGLKRKNPMPEMVGKRIIHRWKVGKRHKWYQGTVVGFSQGVPSFAEEQVSQSLSSYHLYDVKYDGEDETYSLCFEKDWYRGDVELDD